MMLVWETHFENHRFKLGVQNRGGSLENQYPIDKRRKQRKKDTRQGANVNPSCLDEIRQPPIFSHNSAGTEESGAKREFSSVF